ncbi:uncharacterized protein LOC131067761 isoform X1 [Cryptomeria japonica]|uniref:uncharacterized protein LOC131067761 isoform X1 n=1 Tax=Cryptomeria japonica TaxID=3369 RepID=UPI0025AC9328|nr:uncharacterized protein LOC131067761 isoform X1 [Cryptomeria japonica]XP_057858877.1 uncharacterized protein LOC131067761 isoform X1 [Cryptomeria japonica]
METWTKPRQPRALRDLHGVRLVHHTSLQEEPPSKGGFQLSSDAHSEIPGDDRGLFMEFEDDVNFKDSGASSPYIHLRRIWQMRAASLRPVQCNHLGDQSPAETIANVLTSLPFIFLGIQAPRKRMRNVFYANSLIAVGVTSSLYHTSRGDARKYFRWADYAMIATTTICLTTALRNDNPKTLIVASAMMLPFQPFLVSAIHTGIMELDFAKRAASEPELRKAYNLHTASSVVGAALYVADDMFPKTPYLHAGWHLAAAVGVATCNKLLK